MASSLTVFETRSSCFLSVKQLVPELRKPDFPWISFLQLIDSAVYQNTVSN